jgi:lipoprotein-anchoring transpeptidase ErfK/SrfK
VTDRPGPRHGAHSAASRPARSPATHARPGTQSRLGGAHTATRSQLHRFLIRHGWRAYAFPVLLAVTVVALLQSTLPSSATKNGHGIEGLRGASPVAAVTQHPPTAATTAPPPEQLRGVSDSTVCLDNTRQKFVLVSIREQHVWMCQGHQQVYSTPATTGEVDDGDATPTGTWTVQGRQTDRYLVGPGYRDYVHYWIPFNGDFGFHDATWQTMPFGSAGYRSQGSHGCVHLPMTAIRWLYAWAEPGSTLVTVEA